MESDLNFIYNCLDSKKEPKKKIHEEVIAEDYDNAKEEINTIDIAQKFMVSILKSNYSTMKIMFKHLIISSTDIDYLII